MAAPEVIINMLTGSYNRVIFFSFENTSNLKSLNVQRKIYKFTKPLLIHTSLVRLLTSRIYSKSDVTSGRV